MLFPASNPVGDRTGDRSRYRTRPAMKVKAKVNARNGYHRLGFDGDLLVGRRPPHAVFCCANMVSKHHDVSVQFIGGCET